jgi:hypothetical protein
VTDSRVVDTVLSDPRRPPLGVPPLECSPVELVLQGRWPEVLAVPDTGRTRERRRRPRRLKK